MSADTKSQQNEQSPSKDNRAKSSSFVSIPLEDGSAICRICYNDDWREELIKPCLCSGTLGGVHRSCIESWLTITKKTTCTICKFSFRTKQVYKPVGQVRENTRFAQTIVRY